MVFTDELIDRIATAQLGIKAMNFHHAEVTIDLPDDLDLFEDGKLWIQEEKEPGEGDFDPSSIWLKIQVNDLHIEIWDEHADDELHAQIDINAVPGLRELIDAAKKKLIGAMIGRLQTTHVL